MKTIYTLLFLVLVSSELLGAFKLPNNIYDLEDLNEAKEKAISQKKPISFIFTDCESNCGLTKWASEAIIDELKQRTVMIYLPRGTKHPEFLKGAFSEGKFIPKVAVYNLELTEKIGYLIYEDIKEEGEKKAFKEIKKQILDYRKTLQ